MIGRIDIIHGVAEGAAEFSRTGPVNHGIEHTESDEADDSADETDQDGATFAVFHNSVPYCAYSLRSIGTLKTVTFVFFRKIELRRTSPYPAQAP